MKIMAFLFLLLFTSLAAPLKGQSNTAVAAERVTKLIHDDVKASLAGDTNFVKDNYVDGYVEGTSLGTWMTKKQFLDTSSNKVNSRSISDLKVDVFGDTAIARFRQTYDAVIEGKQHSRTTICTQTWNKQAAAWKVIASHCSQVK
jgi:ketosteroid isomerase-like protein